MARRLRFALVVIFFAAFFAYTGVQVYRTITARPSSDLGWSADIRRGRVVIVQVSGNGPGSELRPGDELVAINGKQITDPAQIADFWKTTSPGSNYSVIIRRDGEAQEFSLHTAAFPTIWLALLRAASVVIRSVFLITGFAVFLLKPFNKQATLLAAMFATFVWVLAAGPVASIGSESPLNIGIEMLVRLASIFFAPLLFHFFLVFPEPSPLLRRFPRLEYYLYLPHLAVVFLFSLAADLLLIVAPQSVNGFNRRLSFLLDAGAVMTVVYVVAGLASLIVSYKHAGLAAKRKLRVIVAGTVAGFVPPLFLIGVWLLLTLFRFEFSTVSREPLQWILLIVLISFAFIPFSFAYAILRHQVIPVRVIVRRGVRYLLVSRGFLIIEGVVVFSLLSFLLTGDRIEIIDRIGPRADILATAITTLGSVVLLRRVNRRVMSTIDRRFFRESYDAQQILSELGQAVRTATTTDQMLHLAVVKIQDALHTENVTIFLLDDSSGNYLYAASSLDAAPSLASTGLAERGAGNNGFPSSLMLPRDGNLVNRLRDSGQGLVIEPEEEAQDSPVGIIERRALRRARSALLLPIVARDQVLGIISLGRRLADLPFSREDRRMLMAVAWQMAFALENAKLVHSLADEERLRVEVEIAAEVQRRLFPQRPPEVSDLDLSGICLPARGVGGDYYDFLSLTNGQIGLAVADVAGKGISAALLMSIVQASLRSNVTSLNGRLTDLVCSMNELLHRSTGPHSFATFFYAQYDAQSRLLTYVNAGHNPPLLVRHNENGSTDTRVTLLNIGGPVIGAFSNSLYEQETVEMSCGDTLIAYTDGLTEALNREGQEFGESRLLNLAGEHAGLAAEELSDRIVSSVQQWCGETPQHDDLTLVIMKVR